jgi:hypothetical protein
MPHRPALALVATAIACAGAGVALPSSAQLVRAEPLGAVTTITATTSGTAEVVLYDDASLSPRFDHNPDISISGAGRVVGFRLTRADGGNDTLEGVRLPKFAGGLTDVGGSTNAPTARCTQPALPLAGSCTYPSATAITLHEGYYQLAVLTDGRPVRITLRLHGVARSRAGLRLQKQIRTAQADLPARESIGTSTITYGADTTFAGAMNAAMLVRAKLHNKATLLAASVCARQDSGAAPPYAFSPACPGGANRGVSWSSNNGVRQEFGSIGGLSAYDLAGQPIHPTGLGGSYVDSDGPTYVGGVGIWTWSAELDLFGTPLTPVPGQ